MLVTVSKSIKQTYKNEYGFYAENVKTNELKKKINKNASSRNGEKGHVFNFTKPPPPGYKFYFMLNSTDK